MSTSEEYAPVFTKDELRAFGPKVIFEKAEHRIGERVERLKDAHFIICFDLQDPNVLKGAAKGGFDQALYYMLRTLKYIPQRTLDFSFAIACGYGNMNCALMLLEYGADPFADDNNAYNWALQERRMNILSLFSLL